MFRKDKEVPYFGAIKKGHEADKNDIVYYGIRNRKHELLSQ
jgi:hypothetical protein